MKAWTIHVSGRDYDWRCFFGKHVYTPWQVEENPTPYTPEWAMSWKTCKRCGMWVWKPTKRERIEGWFVGGMFLLLAGGSLVAGISKVAEWIA